MQSTYVNKRGFTIVELLIVIVVIAILAVISVAAYNGVQNSAHKSAVQSDLSNAKRKLDLFKAEHGNYPTNTTDLESLDIAASKDSYNIGGTTGTYANFYYCVNTLTDEFAIAARAKGSNEGYIVSSTKSVAARAGQQLSSSHVRNEVGATDASTRYQTNGMSAAGVWYSWVK